MQIHDSLFLIKPHHCATIRQIPKVTISFENGKWKKEFPGKFSSVIQAKKEIKKLGFKSYKIKEGGIWVRKYFTPWWKVTEFEKDWKEIYKERRK